MTGLLLDFSSQSLFSTSQSASSAVRVMHSETIQTRLALPIASASGWIFPDRPRNSDGFFDIRIPFDRAKSAAGIRDFRWHDLRHTAASYLAMWASPSGRSVKSSVTGPPR